MNKFKKFLAQEDTHKLLASLFAILFGLVFGLVVLFIVTPTNALSAFNYIIKGGFQHNMRGLGNVMFEAAPLILTGLSVGFAFKTGLFNIGASGQFTVGAFTAIYVGVNFTWLPSGLGWIVASLLGMLAGMLWGVIVGFLKAQYNVNEVIGSIMMNYIGMYLVNFLIRATPYDTTFSRTLKPVHAYLPKFGLDKLFRGSSINIAIILAIIVAIIMHIILNNTKVGFEMKAVGFNRHGAGYAGVSEKRNIIASMAIAGALSGLGGALMYLSDAGVYISTINVLLPQGFSGIAIALLAQSNPIATIFSALFISHITYGGSGLQTLGLQPEIIEVITSAIIYVSALSILVKGFLAHRTKKWRDADYDN